MKSILLFLTFIVSTSSFGGSSPAFNVVPAAYPGACNALTLRNLSGDGTSTMEWTFSPAAINAATGLPVTSLNVTAPDEPLVYWTGTPSYSTLTVGYDGETQDFNTCDCNPFAAGNFYDAPLICNTDHYCGNTADAYQVDFLYNNGGGLRANCGFCSGSDNDHSGSIENNSWLRFVADGTSATFDIEVFGSSCYIQFAVYAYDPSAPLGSNGVLTLLTPISWTNISTGFNGFNTITAPGLTPGNTYYLHFDGHGGDDCDYEIGFASGITEIDVTASAASVCSGDPVTLNAIPNDPNAAYTWTDNHGNTYSNSNQIVVNPTVATTYSVSVLLPGCNTAPESVAVGIDPCPLPVELVNFDVKCSNFNNEISWSTLTEYNSDFFEIQKANADMNFRSLGIVEAAGTSNQKLNYSIIDNERNEGEVYYRIRQVDIDGSENFSEMISSSACNEDDFEVIGMTFVQKTSEIVVDFKATRTTNVKLKLVDLSGRPFLSEDLTLEPNGEKIRIQAEDLAGNTMYILNVSSDNTSDTERIYVNR